MDIKYLTENEVHYCKTHEQAFEYASSWIKANENRVSNISCTINTNGVEWYVKIHAHLGHVESEQTMWKVLHAGEDCWTVVLPDGTEKASRYASYAEAEKELDDYLAEQHQAVDDGDMQDKYSKDEFEIVEA